MTMKIAIANQKGGVGKTTTVMNIGAGLAIRDKSVLLVDMDNQNHLSRWLGYDNNDGKPTVPDLIWQTVSGIKQPIDNFIRYNKTENLDYIPANKMLAGIISIIGTDSDSTTVLARLFSDSYFEKYDYILIDCPPTLDLLVSNALKCCDKLLIPVQSDYLAYEGVDELLTTYQKVKPGFDITDCILGMVVTMFQKNTINSNTIFDALKESYGDLVFDTQVSFLVEAKESTMQRTSLVRNSKSRVGQEYMKIADTIIERS